jgi:hypothetical protein
MNKIKQWANEGAAAFVLGALLMGAAFMAVDFRNDYIRTDFFNQYGCQSLGVKAGTVIAPILDDIVLCPALPLANGQFVENMLITVTK